MSGLSSIPPLLSSTPPPMDFGEEEEDGDSVLPNEEDGEYNDFAVNTQSHDNGINPDVPSLPGTPVRLDFNELSATQEKADSKKADISIAAPTKTSIKPVEAFNLAMSTAMLGSYSPPPLEFDSATDVAEHQYVDNEEDEEDFQDFCIAPAIDSDPGSGIEITNEEEDSLKNEDNVSLPSLKFDTLSISSDKLSGCSPTSPSLLHEKNAEQNETKDQPLQMTQDDDSRSSPYEISHLSHGMVKMEDILDDTSDDDTHSPKRKNNINTDDNTTDFFAIHAVNPEYQTTNFSDTLSKGMFPTERENNSEINTSPQDLAKEAVENDDEFDNFTDFTDYQTPKTESAQLTSTTTYTEEETPEEAQNFEFDADFGEFVATTVEHPVKDTEVKQLATLKTYDETFNSFDEDDFEDFQDFAVAPCVQQTEGQTSTEAVEQCLSQSDDTEDEFGEFSDVPFTAATVASTESSASSHNISTAFNRNSLNEKLKPILDLMFPSVNQDENSKLKFAEQESSVCLKLDSIDTAKALDYQWTKSEVRHSLIRSLGIDSRNILFGDKWNSSMPRFAVSLKPLEPLKPQQVYQHTSNVEAAYSNSKDRVGKILKPDVPAVEFDWNSSGLVNPLDGPQEVLHTREAETIHTSQLGTADASIDQQQSNSTFTTNDGDGKLADNANNNATTAPSTVINTAAKTALSSTISADSISHNINENGYNVDIGVCDMSTNSSTNIAVNSIKKATTINTTAPTADIDRSYNLATTCSSNKDVPEVIHDEVVATSTFSGPLKETHIYTPSKIDVVAAATKSATNSTTKTTAPIDFDYEIAAAGIIIDETVVKKEYRDVEYNPGFSLDFIKTQPIDLLTNNDKPTFNDDFFGPLQSEAVESEDNQKLQSADNTKTTPTPDLGEFDDEFSDFQSVPPSSVVSAANVAIQSLVQVPLRTKELVSANNSSRTSTPTFGGREMILSPAILLPQAISMESNKPKIEWGDTTVSINPEELARIEELFPQPKTDSANLHKTATMPNGYQQQTTHKSLSISAAIAQKELHVDDDDWSEFVSVPATAEILAKPKPQTQYIAVNNNNQFSTPTQRQQQQRQHTIPYVAQKTKTSDADEEWSDFVSSAPPQHSTQFRAMPQFNSAAWKNANFYNNPLSFYQSQSQTQTQTQTQTHSNVMPKLNHHNNNSSTHLNYNNNYNKYNQLQQLQHNQHAQQLQLQQQIHIMQDFSTAPPSPHRSSNAASVPNHHSSNAQFQVGSAKVAPSISLIPDLGFIAPAATTHTAFINTLPKPSLITKK